ncbi:MAG: class I SAM-dependent methyltransferase [Patescibacteria group bacterium]
MLLIISWITFGLLTLVLIGMTLYVLGLLISPLFGAPFVPSRKASVEDMLRLANIKPGQRSADLGSGDGRIVCAFASQGADAVGYEINPMLAWYSRLKMGRKRFSGSAQAIIGDFMQHDLSGYDVITAYLMPAFMVKLEPKLLRELKPGSRVVSNSFIFPHWKPIAHEGHVYVYEKTLDQEVSNSNS